MLRSYLTRLHGMGGAVGYLDAYFALQEWKKLATSSEAYESKALNILEVPCCPSVYSILWSLYLCMCYCDVCAVCL